MPGCFLLLFQHDEKTHRERSTNHAGFPPARAGSKQVLFWVLNGVSVSDHSAGSLLVEDSLVPQKQQNSLTSDTVVKDLENPR